ncbi:BnaCnng42260D [Brassica napus]|uniref:BnaCnng42260D protein n=2 Tax=Brassica napus TaxID=3708 RepID=A0A078JC49_BRANA|nr:BnaCnng42260D [Brassica napus]
MDIGNKLRLIFLSIVYVCSTGGSFTHPWFPWFNKGIAFTMTERDRLLPSSAMDSEHQIQRSMTDLKRMEEQARDGLSDPNALAKWRILLQDRNETIHVCQEECIFSAEDRGGMMSMCYNYPAEQPESGSWISRDSWNGAID